MFFLVDWRSVCCEADSVEPSTFVLRGIDNLRLLRELKIFRFNLNLLKFIQFMTIFPYIRLENFSPKLTYFNIKFFCICISNCHKVPRLPVISSGIWFCTQLILLCSVVVVAVVLLCGGGWELLLLLCN